MDYQLTIAGVGAEPSICCWDSESILQLSTVEFHKLRLILEDFGRRSAKAQGLGQPITDIFRIRGSDQRIYLHLKSGPQGTTVYGGLKVGKKKLFIRQDNGAVVEMEPTCVLDFYVHESCQRVGVGKSLFEHFLATERHQPWQLAYDRPSAKLLAFLRKYYGLSSYTPQNNNFVVFHAYFQQQQQQPQQPQQPQQLQQPQQAQQQQQQQQRWQQKQLSTSGRLERDDWVAVNVRPLSMAHPKQHSQGWPYEPSSGSSPSSRPAGVPRDHVPLTLRSWEAPPQPKPLQHNDALDRLIRYEDREQRPPLSSASATSSASCTSPGARMHAATSSSGQPLPSPYAKPVWSAANNMDGTYRPRAPWAPTDHSRVGYGTAPPSNRSQDGGLGPYQAPPPPPPTHTVLTAALAEELKQCQQNGSSSGRFGESGQWGGSMGAAPAALLSQVPSPQLLSQYSSRRTSRCSSRDARDSAAFQRSGSGAASCMRYL